MGAARCLCSGRRPERSAWLGSYFRVPFTSVRCADVPPTAREAGPQAGRGAGLPKPACHCPAVMAPSHVGLRADDAVASHRGADGPVPSIQPARTYAHGTSRGAVAVMRAGTIASSPCPGPSTHEQPRPSTKNDIVADRTVRSIRSGGRLPSSIKIFRAGGSISIADF
jgi:hypothetical protein